MVFVIVTGQRVTGPQQAESTQPEQGRPEPADAIAGDQAVAKTDQFVGTQHLRRGRAVMQKGCCPILITIGRDVLVIGAIFTDTDQLALAFEEAFDDQLRLIRAGAFGGHMQVVADTLDGNVFRSDWFITALGKNVFAVLHGLDTYRLTLLGGAKLHRLGNGFAVHNGDVHCVCVHLRPSFVRLVTAPVIRHVLIIQALLIEKPIPRDRLNVDVRLQVSI